MKAICARRRHEIALFVQKHLEGNKNRLVLTAEKVAPEVGVSKWTAVKFYYQLMDNVQRGVEDPLSPQSAFVRGSFRANQLRRSRYRERMETDGEYAARQKRFRRESLVRHYQPYSVLRTHRGMDYFFKRLVIFARSRVRRGGGENADVDLTWETLQAMWERQQGLCPVSGLPMDFTVASKHPLIPSLDRIDPAEGYTPENSRLVCYFVNLMKRDFSDDDVREMLSLASHYAITGEREQGPVHPLDAVQAKLTACLRNAKRRYYERKWECDLDLDLLESLYEEQEGRCALSGAIMQPEALTSRAISLDRIDSKQPYTLENVHLVCLSMNIAKLDNDVELLNSVLRACPV